MSLASLLLPGPETHMYSSAVPFLSPRHNGGGSNEQNWLYWMPNHKGYL